MREDDLRLVELSADMEEAFLDIRREVAESGDTNISHLAWEEYDSFAEHVERLKAATQGRGLPEGWVPGTYYFLVNGAGRILAMTNLRHRLVEHLLREGGHIGYVVRKSERGKGYATRMCAMVIDKAREMGIERVLITCDKDNVASARVIRKNGGVLENKVAVENGKVLQRYWISLESGGDDLPRH